VGEEGKKKGIIKTAGTLGMPNGDILGGKGRKRKEGLLSLWGGRALACREAKKL